MRHLFSYRDFVNENSSGKLEDREKLISLAEEYFNCTGIFFVDEKNRVCTNGSVTFENSFEDEFTEFPVQFGRINGSFEITGAKNLSSLKGSPVIVGHNYVIWDCPKITSLEGSPRKIGGQFMLNCPNLESLMGGPIDIESWDIADWCPKIPQEEFKLYSEPVLRKAWLESGMEASKFIKEKRGLIAKKKFGF